MNNNEACAEYFRGNSAYRRCFSEFEKKWKTYGKVTGIITLKNTSEEERRAIGGILGKTFYENTIRFPFAEFEKGLQYTKFAPVDFEQVLEAYFGRKMLTTQERQKEAERGKADFFETVESYLTECTGPDSIAVSWLQDMFSQKKYGYQTVIREYGRDREKTEKLLKTVGKAILLLEDIRETEEEYPLAVFSAEVSGNPHYFDQGTTGGQFDTPIQEGYSKDFYDEIIGFMRNFFSGAFKDNKNLTYGFLTGILRIAQESIFSGLNNLTVNSVMDEEYDQFFGFTVSEVREMLKYYGVLDKEEELKDWYDGYLFGSTEIYNPWSVINYISRGCIPQAYWVNTGKNEILEDVLKVATEDITERLYSLLQGERVIARIDQNVVYRSLSEDPANIYSLLLVAGYLKTPKKELQADGSYLCEVSIPNREIAAVYKSEVLSHLLQIGAITRTTANKIAESLYANDYKNLQKAIAEYMDKSVSFYDAGAEGFYHGLVLGLIALMDNQYKIKSNRESGDGRYDIGLFPREDRYPGILMELKWKKNLSADELSELADEALAQIGKKRYDVEMKENGTQDILKFGIVFSGKKVSVKIE